MRLSLLPAFAALLVALSAAPAFAGSAEASFLSKLAGSWSGKGNLAGAETGPVACKMVIRAGDDRVNYTGRCNIQDVGAQSFAGSIGYNDSTRHFEATSLNNTVVGVKQGGAIVFTTKSQSAMGSSYSTMSLSPTRLSIDFTILRNGQKTRSHISFGK